MGEPIDNCSITDFTDHFFFHENQFTKRNVAEFLLAMCLIVLYIVRNGKTMASNLSVMVNAIFLQVLLTLSLMRP